MSNIVYGKADWKDFIQESKLYTINGKEFVSTFKNTKGRDIYKIGDLYYEWVGNGSIDFRKLDKKPN